jgi:hypothetical protein
MRQLYSTSVVYKTTEVLHTVQALSEDMSQALNIIIIFVFFSEVHFLFSIVQYLGVTAGIEPAT